ncbi:type II toxin-antitoxin system HicA family toxin [Pararhizobium sp. PWRC1-1]|uniref:type II toxin-antitoxin system HicA family toxin n=1 Tax=Pararhizobium sp. PWRC1-1 TaxID=2804566 RepID=UPI003CF49021
MNSKQRKTLAAIFKEPASGTIDWADIESLLVAAGCTLIEGSGSRVRFTFSNEVESFHRPHPENEAKRYQVRAARGFLLRIGVTP